MESWKTWCINAGLEREIVPGGLCINDSNLVLEAVRLGKGIALERRSLVQDALSRGELVQLTPFTAPYPWPYWLVSSQGAEQKTEAILFKAWLDEEVAAWPANWRGGGEMCARR
jgi:LysR family glycine cleavage system transcriptional activator